MSAANHHESTEDVAALRSRIAHLEQQLARLHSICDATDNAIFMKDAQCRHQFMNAAGLRILGKPEAEVIGKTAFDLFAREAAKQFDIDDREVLHTGDSRVYEYQLPSGDGWRTLVVGKSPVRDAGGAIVGLVGVTLDITERKEAESSRQRAHEQLEAKVAERTKELQATNRVLADTIGQLDRLNAELRDNREQARGIIEALPVPTTITRVADGLILYANDRVDALLGMRGDGLTGEKISDFYYDPDERNGLLEALEKVGFVRNREIRARRADGGCIWVAVSMQRIRYKDENAILAAFVDITNRREAEELLRHERQLLRRLVDIHERDQKVTALEIHDGLVQHMAGALMYLQSAGHRVAKLDPNLSAPLEVGIGLVKDSIDEARRMINGLRPPVLEQAGVIAAIENLVEEISSTSGLDIEFQHQTQFGELAPGLEMTMYRLVQEALNNVWQHSKSKNAVVQILQQGDDVSISIEDWGVGFNPDVVSHRRFGISGIRERARMLGGRAEIKSGQGSGTRVEVTLPLKESLSGGDG